MKIGEIIKLYRKSHGLSMGDFAQKTGLSKAYISMLERNINSSTGKPIVPSGATLKSCALAMNISLRELFSQLDEDQLVSIKDTLDVSLDSPPPPRIKGIRIPILGRVVAGIPLEAIEDIEGYEEITPEMARKGEYFALRVRGKSMEPFMLDGDIVIVRKQEAADSGDIVIVLVNGDEATVKEIKIHEDGLMLIGKNVAVYSPHFYNQKQIEELPVQIIGKGVEVRRSL